MSTQASKENTSVSGHQIVYFTTKDFDRALKAAFMGGGQRQKKATKVRAILGSLNEADPFSIVPLTNHGEARIPHCVKYDLGDGWRLITQKTEKTCGFLFIGDHDDADAWLSSHQGQRFGIKDGKATLISGIGRQIDYAIEDRADHHDRPLVDLIDSDSMDFVLNKIQRSIARKIEALNCRAKSADINEIVAQIADPEAADLISSVFALLLAGDHNGAQAHIDLCRGVIRSIEDYDHDSSIEIADSDSMRRLRIGSKEYEEWIRTFERESPWYEWFLYLHPEQERIVNANYEGPAQLSGVSGSGKTCISVRRALRLAESREAKVLLLTLNRSLAGLLDQLVDAACPDENIRKRIEVSSFFQLAQFLLLDFEPHNNRLYADVTWKLSEHVDEVFREYYRQWTNNKDAQVLLTLHKSLNARGVSGETYIREEFDWIRSAVLPESRQDYLTLDRKGRKFPIPPDRRKDLIQGLAGWEKKMRNVGVIDYLGLTSALSNYISCLVPQYTNIIVDEAQDFGTTELKVVRALVSPGSNDIFLCGDVAQTILPKHRSVSEAGITNLARDKLRQNYRNSREILIAAYELLRNNLSEDMFDSEDLEILDPKFANFSGPVPMALACGSLEDEIAYARTYAATRLSQGVRTVCIAFAGFSVRDIKEFAARCEVTALDGTYDPNTDRLVFCDLEDTKGYEFDTLIIIQCTDGVLPPREAPPEESFRTSCKLYVAMTRAKTELILSFHDKASSWIEAVSGAIGIAKWDEIESLNPEFRRGSPDVLPELEPGKRIDNILALTGAEFIYTSESRGLSIEAQDKLIELVDGRGLRAAGGGRRLKWADMASLASDFRESHRADSLFGPVVGAELRRQISSLEDPSSTRADKS